MGKNITQKIYDKHAVSWERKEPSSLSDFTGRPAVFDMCGDVSGLRALDIGCGEGYCSRVLKEKGAARVDGIDISAEMIERAKSQEAQGKLGINYETGDIQHLNKADSSYDLVLGMFVYNYLTVDEMMISFKEVHRVLDTGGGFVFSVPHPAFPFIRKDLDKPFYFDFDEKGYFTSRNIRHHGAIFCRDGNKLPVQMVHKLLEDYMSAFKLAGFSNMPDIKELSVLDKHIDLDESFFSPVSDIPLHMAFKVEK